MNKLLNKYFLITVLVVGFLLRMVSINQSLWMDESISAYVVKNYTYTGIINDFIKADTHPPLYYIILKFWTGIFGYSEISLRFPSVLFGTLTILVISKLGNLIDKRVSRIAALMSSFSPLLIYYSQEARMYSLTTLLVCICFYFFLTRNWKFFAVTLALLGASDYMPLVVLSVFWIIALVNKYYKTSIYNLLVSQIPLFLFYLYWFPIFNTQRISTLISLGENPGWGQLVGMSNLKNVALVWIKFLIGRVNFVPQQLYIFVVVVTSIVAIVALIKSFVDWRKMYVYILWLILPIVGSFAIFANLAGFSYFRLIFTLPAFILLAANGFSTYQKSRWLFIVFIGFELFFATRYLFFQNFWREDWKAAVPFVEKRLKPGEAVFVSYKESFTPYEWYAQNKQSVKTFQSDNPEKFEKLYTLDYLMDLTDPNRSNYQRLESLGYINTEIFNFRGVGQVRYWVKI